MTTGAARYAEKKNFASGFELGVGYITNVSLHCNTVSTSSEETYVESVVESGDEAHPYEEEGDPATPDTQRCPIRNLSQITSLSLPGHAETDVGQTARAPDEEVRETRKSKEPGKGITTLRSIDYISQETEDELDNDAPHRSSMLVDVGQKLRSHTTFSQRLHRASRAESTGIGHTDDGDGDDSVEDRW